MAGDPELIFCPSCAIDEVVLLRSCFEDLISFVATIRQYNEDGWMALAELRFNEILSLARRPERVGIERGRFVILSRDPMIAKRKRGRPRKAR